MIISFLVATIVMGLLDFVWLAYISKKLYSNELGDLILKKPKMIAALLFYVIYLIGVVVFVVDPALISGSALSALAYGALFGLVAYSTYDLTNLATLKGFKTKIVIIDLIWGSFLTATTSVVTYLVVNLWMK